MCVESLKLQRSSISLIATVTASIDVCGDRGRGFCHDAVESPVSDERGRNICHGQVIWPILNDCGKSGCHGEVEFRIWEEYGGTETLGRGEVPRGARARGEAWRGARAEEEAWRGARVRACSGEGRGRGTVT